MGDYGEAEEMHNLALEGQMKVLGKRCVETMFEMAPLANLLEDQKRQKATILNRWATEEEDHEVLLQEHYNGASGMDVLGMKPAGLRCRPVAVCARPVPLLPRIVADGRGQPVEHVAGRKSWGIRLMYALAVAFARPRGFCCAGGLSIAEHEVFTTDKPPLRSLKDNQYCFTLSIALFGLLGFVSALSLGMGFGQLLDKSGPDDENLLAWSRVLSDSDFNLNLSNCATSILGVFFAMLPSYKHIYDYPKYYRRTWGWVWSCGLVAWALCAASIGTYVTSKPVSALFSGAAGMLQAITLFSSNRIFEKTDAETKQAKISQPFVTISDDDDGMELAELSAQRLEEIQIQRRADRQEHWCFASLSPQRSVDSRYSQSSEQSPGSPYSDSVGVAL